MAVAAAAQAVSPAAAEKPAASPEPGSQELRNQEPKNQELNREELNREGSNREEERWQPLLDLPCDFAVELPAPSFKVGDFLKLQAGSVIATNWRLTHDVPLRVNGALIGWGEFDGSGNRLAVRLTELA